MKHLAQLLLSVNGITGLRFIAMGPSISCSFNLLVAAISIYCSIATQPSDALRNSIRSVEFCDYPAEGQPDFDKDTCRSHCKQYILGTSEIWDANWKVYRFEVEQTDHNENLHRCCCTINTPWPEFVKPEQYGVQLWQSRLGGDKLNECLPLMISVNLKPRTRTAYDTLCHHLASKSPLNMLDLLQLCEAAAYLNYMRPKHPSIRQTIKSKDIARINKDVVASLEMATNAHLLDSFKPLVAYGGTNLDSHKLNEFHHLLKDTLAQALTSKIIARSLDEYVSSYTLVDVAAASERIKELNHEMGVPAELVAGEYDKYNPQIKAAQFSVPNLNCRLLYQTHYKLKAYISDVQRLLGSLFEKGYYSDMERKYKTFIYLLDSRRVYEDLIKYTCEPNKRRL